MPIWFCVCVRACVLHIIALVFLACRPEENWWLGQNIHTRKIGRIPRKLMMPLSGGLTGDDISKPLEYSFIHTGHGDSGGNTWGHPDKIDEWVWGPSSRPQQATINTSNILTQSPVVKWNNLNSWRIVLSLDDTGQIWYVTQNPI